MLDETLHRGDGTAISRDRHLKGSGRNRDDVFPYGDLPWDSMATIGIVIENCDVSRYGSTAKHPKGNWSSDPSDLIVTRRKRSLGHSHVHLI